MKESPEKEKTIYVEKEGFLPTPIAILLGSLLISIAILASGGGFNFRTMGLFGGDKTAQTIQTAPQPSVTAAPQPVKVSVDDDPVLGDKNAKLTMIEFSDYECPFCKKYFSETYPSLKKDYIDTGKLKSVFRDLPLSFHQNAQREAEAVNCAREQGGDASYFKYHDEIFKRTTSNGTGLALDQLPVIAGEVGLNVSTFQQCLDSGKYKEEISKDMADANKAGITGTPGFFIGYTNNEGTIDGIKVVPDNQYPENLATLYDKNNKLVGVKIGGAFPYDTFKTYIDTLINSR